MNDKTYLERDDGTLMPVTKRPVRESHPTYYDAKFAREAKDKPSDWSISGQNGRYYLTHTGVKP